MAFKDIRSFIAALEAKGQLVRVTRQVDPILEVNAILDRLARTEGPAVLFENVKGSKIPLFGNAFGTMERAALAFGGTDIDEIVSSRIEEGLSLLRDKENLVLNAIRARSVKQKVTKFKKAVASRQTFEQMKSAMGMMSVLPVETDRKSAPCKEVVLEGSQIDLNRFPLIKLWPHDGERYITLPLVITRDPETRDLNVGIYRMMYLDRNKACMHWLPRKHGNLHFQKAEEMGKPLDVAVAIGCDPAIELSGVLQLMPPLDEYMVAGMAKGESVELVEADNSDLPVPAHAEIILEGTVEPGKRVMEGPFGEFNGYYSEPKETPIFEVKKITMRKKPIFHAATTGLAPTEIHVFAKVMERVGVVVSRIFMPEIQDYNLTKESGCLYCMIISLKKTRPYHAQDAMQLLWGIALQNAYITNLIVVDHDVNVHNLSDVLQAVSLHFRPDQDLTLLPRGTADLEHPGCSPRGVGGKMGIDATRKWRGENYLRAPQERVSMDDAVQKQVESLWRSYGFK